MARAPPSLNILLLLYLGTIGGVASIGCFVCSSFDGENKACEDPFNSTIEAGGKEAGTIANYHHPCWAFKKGRQGVFPADHCIKINGYRVDPPVAGAGWGRFSSSRQSRSTSDIADDNSSKTIVIRTCALDSGTLTADTEIVRISHCGNFKYEGVHYRGCVQSCDTDGCNPAPPSVVPLVYLLALLSLLF